MPYPYTNCTTRGPESLRVPASVRRAAKAGLKMIEEGYSGGVETGHKRAKQLAECDYISIDAVKVMQRFYSRHMYTSLPGYLKWHRDGMPTFFISGMKNNYRGAVSLLIWGGIAAFDWIRSSTVQSKLNKYFEGGKNSLLSFDEYKKRS